MHPVIYDISQTMIQYCYVEQGQYTEANQRFEYALGKTSFGENIEQIRYRLQEGLRLCKVKMNRKSEVALFSYSRGFGDGPRNFEPWSSDEDDTRTDTASPNFHTTPTRGRLSVIIFNVHLPPLHGGSSAVLGSNS
ncbi:hypothetical protein TNCV_3611881 [Trichonephila clavipes]|nr:hypothetical protein TNCV_3611881 [Trichonephila clavipes]